MNVLLLRAPSRRPNDVGITLRAPAGSTTAAGAMAVAAIAAACPPPVAERVRACIFHSGRYDCRISAGAAFVLASRPALLSAFGGSIKITDDLAA